MRLGERMVQLVDGTEVSNYSEAWRAECEARTVLAMPREQRLAHYEGCAKRRGHEAALQLRDAVRRLYELTRGQA